MARRIVIKRRQRPEVLRMPATKFLPRPSYGAGDDQTEQYHCTWCFANKKRVTEKCGNCGHFGATKQTQKEISQVYVEDNPVFLEEAR